MSTAFQIYRSNAHTCVSGEYAVHLSDLLREADLVEAAQLYEKGTPPVLISRERAQELMKTEPWHVALALSISFLELPLHIQECIHGHAMERHLQAGGTENDDVAHFFKRIYPLTNGDLSSS